MFLPGFVRRNLPPGAVLAWRRFKARRLIEAYAAEPGFADESVDLRKVKLFRRESFPASGPVPWLDRPDAEELIAERLAAGEITEREAALCRKWREQGFLLLEGFNDGDFVDRVWGAVERAVESGGLPFDRDTMSEGDDVYEDRILDLHQRLPELDDQQFMYKP